MESMREAHSPDHGAPPPHDARSQTFVVKMAQAKALTGSYAASWLESERGARLIVGLGEPDNPVPCLRMAWADTGNPV